MPRNKKQGLIFTVLMVCCMVYVMSVYNIAIGTGRLTYDAFLHALLGMPVFILFAFVVENFGILKVVKSIVPKLVRESDPPIFRIIVTSGLTVSMMAPTMSLFATLYNFGFDGDWILRWLRALMFNLPAALLFQVMYVGPFVRFTFRTFFSQVE